MSERSTYSIRLDERERTVLDAALDNAISEQGFEGRGAPREALVYIMEKSLLGFTTSPSPSSIHRLSEAVGCDFLESIDDTYYCLESMGKYNKKPRELSDSEAITRALCAACKRAKEIEAIKFEAREQRRESIRRLKIFRDMLIKIGRQGFETSIYLCTCNANKNDAVFLSRDGVTLPCPLQELKAVNIDKTCRLVIDPNTRRSPCRFLVEETHTVTPDFKAEEQAVEVELLQLEDKDAEVIT